MTEAQDARREAAKRMRRAARILGLSWACCWTLVMGAGLLMVWVFADTGQHFTLPPQFYLVDALVSLPPWVAVAISWRWDAIGGVLFVLQSFFMLIVGTMLYLGVRVAGWAFYLVLAPALLLECGGVWALALGILFPLAVGILFLVSWRKSRTSETPQETP